MELSSPLYHVICACLLVLCAGQEEPAANTLPTDADFPNRTRLTIIHYNYAFLNGTIEQTDVLMQTLQRALVAFPDALLLNPTGHLGKRLWIQHDGSTPNLADIVQLQREAELRSSDVDPLLAANVRVPGRAHIRRSTVRQLPGQRRVGVVGFVSEATGGDAAVSALHVKVSPPVEAVRAEALRLRGNGVPVIVALGNAGYPEDELIASRVNEVDVVVAHGGGGDGYPVGIRQDGPRGKVVPLLQAPVNSVCLTTVVIDNGRLVDWGGIRIPVAEVAEESEAVEEAEAKAEAGYDKPKAASKKDTNA